MHRKQARARYPIHFRSLLAFVALALAGITETAAMSRVDPGELPTLEADEGLLLVAIDSNIALESVHVRKDGKLFGAGVLSRLQKGRNSRLYVAKAGRYEWSRVHSFMGIAYKLSDDAEYDFEVKPGRVTYPGDLIFRPRGWYSATIHVANRGLAALDWLHGAHPVLAQKYPFEYIGHYPDPFPAFYREATREPNALAGPFGSEMAAPPPARPLPLPPKDLWQDDRVSLARISPGGKLLALQVKSDDLKSWAVDLVDLASGETQRIARSDFAFASIQWSGDSSLLIALGASDGPQIVNLIKVRPAADGRQRFERIEFPRTGRILSILPDDPDHVLFASVDKRGALLVHKVDISTAKALRGFSGSTAERINAGTKEESWWYADASGALRVALLRRDDESILATGGAGGFTDVLRLRADGGFEPGALSADGGTLYGFTDEDRAQRDFVEFDIATRRVARTLFSKPGVDVVSALYDRKRKPIGVRYYQSGRLVSDYFEQQDRHVTDILGKAFPNRSVAVIDRSSDAGQLVLSVDGSDQPAKLFHLDVAVRRASLVEDVMPALAGRRFAPSKVIHSTGKDGLPIESYLTLPSVAGPVPLVVLAHGGPVGVSDNLHFDRDVQFLTSLGYAVLRVNFRGSGGYGKAFREAGHHNYGTLIEDDIDRALGDVLAREPIDPQRMCAVGFSYGGYSALVSAVRWPDRFRCVVSVSGVSDLLLFFTASDGGRSSQGRSELERVIGNPATDARQMQQSSPLYRYRELKVPVMLAHGQEDLRVDFEHTRRLKRMLDIAGNPPVGLVYPDEEHSYWEPASVDSLWSGIAGFLQKYLDAGTGNAAPPTATP